MRAQEITDDFFFNLVGVDLVTHFCGNDEYVNLFLHLVGVINTGFVYLKESSRTSSTTKLSTGNTIKLTHTLIFS